MRPVSATRIARTALLVSVMTACAGARPDATNSASTTTPTDADADAGAGAADAASAEPVFAGSAAEATSLISATVDKHSSDIALCARDFRARKKLGREKVSVSFGIDQEGKLLGVTSRGKEDAELKSCVQNALNGAQFPRSHAGVITVTKTYGEHVQ